MVLIRTFVNRGKRAMELSELKPNGIYAVRTLLPVEIMAEWGVTNNEQWGIIMLDAQCNVRRSWNIVRHNVWTIGTLPLSELKIFRSSETERQFACEAETAQSYAIKLQQSAVRITSLQREVDYFKRNRWHKIADRLNRFFS